MASIRKEPIVFKPFLKSVIWGGNKICKLKGISQLKENIGESWEISQVPGFESVVAEGEYKDLSITQLIEMFDSELLGDAVIAKYGKFFPLLIKFIDAQDNLSVQVHPNDELAKKRHNSLGKTEMWYILSSDKGARIYAGLKENLDAEEYEERIKNDTFLDAVTYYLSKPEDVYFLPAGIVHAIGAGNLLTEIQESSDITYRLYDYNRKDKNGNPRELHTELAKDAIDYNYKEKCLKKGEKINDGISKLVDCDHFITHKITINGEKSLNCNKDSFRVMICTEGKVDVACKDGNKEITSGYTILVPAYATTINLRGKGNLIMTSVFPSKIENEI